MNRSSFTRAQRVATIFCALYLTMISNAMFYKTDNTEDEPSAIATIGPVVISMQELFVSAVSIAIVFPVTIFVTLGRKFRKFSFANERPAEIYPSRHLRKVN